jgi:hypothetical protein
VGNNQSTSGLAKNSTDWLSSAISAHSRSKALVREARERREVKPFLFFITMPAVKDAYYSRNLGVL